MPLLFIAAIIWQPKAKAAFINVRIAISQVYSSFSENLNGIKEVQNFNREKSNFGTFQTETNTHPWLLCQHQFPRSKIQDP